MTTGETSWVSPLKSLAVCHALHVSELDPCGCVPALRSLSDLQQAYADYDAGKIDKDEFVKAQDKSVEDSLSNMSQTGETLITDGEQRASS